MPDLTLVLMQECKTWGCQSEKWRSQGGCWPWKKYGTCKHVCGWHEIVGDPPQTEEQRKNMICPKCGGPTRWVRVGV